MYGVCILPILFVDTYHTRHFFSWIGDQDHEKSSVWWNGWRWMTMTGLKWTAAKCSIKQQQGLKVLDSSNFHTAWHEWIGLIHTYSSICPQVLKCSRISGLACNMTNPELTSQLWIWWSSLKLTVFITWKWIVGILVSLIPFGCFGLFSGANLLFVSGSVIWNICTIQLTQTLSFNVEDLWGRSRVCSTPKIHRFVFFMWGHLFDHTRI